MNHVHVFIIGIALSSGNSCSDLLERGALIYQKARTIQSEYTIRPFFQFSDDIRRIMYTTNIIEGLNRQFRKVTKTKSSFPSDTALEKMLYLASQDIVKNGFSVTGTGI